MATVALYPLFGQQFFDRASILSPHSGLSSAPSEHGALSAYASHDSLPGRARSFLRGVPDLSDCAAAQGRVRRRRTFHVQVFWAASVKPAATRKPVQQLRDRDAHDGPDDPVGDAAGI